MPSLTDAEKEWIHWCHSDQPAMYGIAALEAVKRMLASSPYPQPIILAESRKGNRAARGYAIACQGAIGYVGRLLCMSPQAEQQDLLAKTAADLCSKTLATGVELVQAILPISSSDPAESKLRQAFQSAGMICAARLLQFTRSEVPFRNLEGPWSMTSPPIEFRPFRQMTRQQWRQLVEETYIDTLDVPILNGIRSTEQTLRGYAVGQSEDCLPWWSIHLEDFAIGCLILTRLSESDCELTYLGLIPEARGHRLGPEILDYVSDWMMEEGKSRIFFAVDEKNTPALQLYRNFGFEPFKTVEAWIISPSSGG